MNVGALLWLAWAGLLSASLISGQLEQAWWPAARLDLRTMSCLVLALAAWWGWWTLRKHPAAAAARWFAIGMSLGFYGDSHVAKLLWWPPFPDPLLGGIFFYGLGHLAYVTGSLDLARRLPTEAATDWRWPILGWQFVAALAWIAVALTTSRNESLRTPTLLYTALVAATPGAAGVLYQRSRAFAALLAGGGLFLLSDVLLAYQAFHGSFPGIDELTWLCYGPGEMLIVYGSRLGIAREPRLARP